MRRGHFRGLPTASYGAVPARESSDLGTRIWEQQVYGGMTRHFITPADYATPVLACRLADKWLEIGPEVRGSMTSVRMAIRGFLASVGEQPRDSEHDELFDLPDLRRRHLDHWETTLLRKQQDDRTGAAYQRAIYLLALLRRIHHDTPGVLHGEVVSRLERETRLTDIRGEGEPAFSPEEVERLRDAAQRIVNEALARHRQGDEAAEAPSIDVIVALHILLSLGTGEPPEVLRRLHIHDVLATAVPGRDEGLEHLEPAERLSALVRRRGVRSFCVCYVKNRAAQRYQQVYTRSEEEVFKPLTALITLTASARRQSGLTNLWLIKRDSEIVEPFWGTRPLTLRTWLRRNPTDAEQPCSGGTGFSEPLKFSRLRKSVTAEEALADPARYLRGNRRHTAQTFFEHYTNSAVLRAEAGRILLRAIGELFDAAVHGPTIVTPAAEELLAAGHEAPTIDRDTAKRLLAGALDTGTAACRDPLDSPHAEHGNLCPFATTGDCYSCSNALITRHHLPAVLRLRELTDPGRAADIPFWQERWKLVHEFITRVILPAFPATAITAARERQRTVLLDAGLLNDLGGADAPA